MRHSKLNTEEQEPQCQLPSNNSNTSTDEASVDTQQTAVWNMEVNKTHQAVRKSSLQSGHPLFTIQGKDSTSTTIAADWDTHKNTLTLTIEDCDVVVVGQSTTIQYQSKCDHCSQAEQMQTNSFDKAIQTANGSKREDGSIKRTEMSAKQDRDDNQMQLSLNETQECEEAKTQNLSAELLAIDVEPSMPLIEKQGYLNGPQCEQTMEQLELFQDNGKFDQHKRLVTLQLKRCENRKITNMALRRETKLHGAQCEQVLKQLEVLQIKGKLDENENLFSLYSRLCREGENADMEISLIIEQAVSFMYHKEFKKSKVFLTSVIQLGNYCQLRNAAILIARARFLLVENNTHMYERDKKIQALLKCLEHSEDLLKHHNSPEDWAELCYNYGLAWLAVMSTIPDDDRSAQARKHARENARCYFERAIAFCKKDPRLRVQVKKLTYCNLGAAAVLLDCTSTAARTEQKHITPEDIKDAQGHLDFVERVLGDCLPLGSRMHLFKTRSDQYYRQGFYLLAKETAENALHIATSNGFKTELVTLQERIDFLNRLYEEKIRLTTDNDADNSYSDNDASCEASGSETTAKPVSSL